ncbi:MAG: ABC transporter substrate-binding protein [Clostridia bacterium]|nr:ABC transporter substrate-binding protein [Clostridia bacterium]
MRKVFALILVLGLLAGVAVGCGQTTPEPSGTTPAVTTKAPTGTTTIPSTSEYNTLVLGYDEFNGVFSPFFGTTGYDMDVTNMTMEALIRNNPEGEPMDGLAKYVTPVELKDAAGKVLRTVYTFELKEGVKYSDGTPVTADDIIFAYKVYLDPTYDGPSTLFVVPIVGANEYRYNDANYKAKIKKIGEEAAKITDDEVTAYIKDYCAADYEAYGAEEINNYTGFKNPDGLTGDALKAAEIQAYVDVEVESYWDDHKASAIDVKKTALEQEYIQAQLESKVTIDDITGIKKIDDRTVEITIEGVDPTAIWQLGGVQPVKQTYYGDGYIKGDLSTVKAKNSAPMGAGAYVFESYENNVVTFTANENYYLGAPKIPKIKFQVIDTSNKLESIKLGDTDISDPPCSPDNIAEVEAAGLHYATIMNNGYGYIGINADNVTDRNVRKGLMSLMNRAPSVRDWYGDTAVVIERPMSTVSWAYPKDAKAVYPYSKDEALKFFKAAGYVQEQQGGKTVLAKDGVQLSIEAGIPGDGSGAHPSYKILTQMKIDLESLGGVLEIRDVGGQVFFETLDADGWDIWCAAWGSTIDPDMYQVYHSGQSSNHYSINDPELDKLLEEGRATNDVEKRKEIYGQCLDIIMDWAVEMPVYQRMNMYVFNPEIVNIDTLPEEMTPFYGYFAEVQTLELH